MSTVYRRNPAAERRAGQIRAAYDDARAFGYAHRSCLAFARSFAAKIGVTPREAESICTEHAGTAGSLVGGREAGSRGGLYFS